MLYFFWLLFLFTLLYANTSDVSRIINDAQTSMTLLLLEPFLKSGQLQGIDIIIHPHYKIIITQACNGMIPILFLSSAILAFPSSIFYKVFWIVLGYLLFNVVNVLRILLVVYFVEQKEGRENFYLSHDILGNILLMALGVGLFVAFIKHSKR